MIINELLDALEAKGDNSHQAHIDAHIRAEGMLADEDAKEIASVAAYAQKAPRKAKSMIFRLLAVIGRSKSE